MISRTILHTFLMFTYASSSPATTTPPRDDVDETRLAATLTADRETLSWGEPVAFLLSVTNHGPDIAHDVLVSATWEGIDSLLGQGTSAASVERENDRLAFASLSSLEVGHTASWQLYGIADHPGTVLLRTTIGSRHLINPLTCKAKITVANRIPGLDADYDELGQKRHPGLEPLGRNRDGYWEFWMPITGEKPIPGRYGEYRIEEETAMVFVLIPGGTYVVGAQRSDRKGPYYDGMSREDEQPPHAVQLDPYFISKYEMTQGQWQRTADENPSVNNYLEWQWDDEHYRDDMIRSHGGHTLSPLMHPVENVSWDDSTRILATLDLLLPTEAQWEAAARGGTTTPWWCGAKSSTKSSLQFDTHRHAPVDWGSPNDLGLFNVLGGVWEWCRDGYGPYSNVPRVGDGLRVPPDAMECVMRGGGHGNDVQDIRCAIRANRSPGYRHAQVGCRPVMNVTVDR